MASSILRHLRLDKALTADPHLLNRFQLFAIGCIVGSLGVLGVLGRASYKRYIALGKGGIPHNILGWLAQGVLLLVAKRDTRSVAPFSRPRTRATLGEVGTRTFLGSVVIPERSQGEEDGRPTVPGFVVPQRQIDQLPGPVVANADEIRKMRGKMEGFLEELVAANPGVLVMKPSALEGVGTPAVWLDTSSLEGRDLPKFMNGSLKGETAHVHPECSSHVTLSMADAEEVVRKGWAERHKLSGVGGYLPWTYLLIYAPRDESELGLWKGIIAAGVRFVCGASGKEVRVSGD